MTPTLRTPLYEHPNYPQRLCREGDPNRFCVGDGESGMKARVRLTYVARTLCRHCPLLVPCRKAGEQREWGLWGGVLYGLSGDGRAHGVDLLKEAT